MIKGAERANVAAELASVWIVSMWGRGDEWLIETRGFIVRAGEGFVTELDG